MPATRIDNFRSRGDWPRRPRSDLWRFRVSLAACRPMGPWADRSCLLLWLPHAVKRRRIAFRRHRGVVGSHPVPISHRLGECRACNQGPFGVRVHGPVGFTEDALQSNAIFTIWADGQNSEVPGCGGLNSRWFLHAAPPLKNPDFLPTLLRSRDERHQYSRIVERPVLVLAFSGVVSPSVIVLLGTNPLQVILSDTPAPAKSGKRGCQSPAGLPAPTHPSERTLETAGFSSRPRQTSLPLSRYVFTFPDSHCILVCGKRRQNLLKEVVVEY